MDEYLSSRELLEPLHLYIFFYSPDLEWQDFSKSDDGTIKGTWVVRVPVCFIANCLRFTCGRNSSKTSSQASASESMVCMSGCAEILGASRSIWAKNQARGAIPLWSTWVSLTRFHRISLHDNSPSRIATSHLGKIEIQAPHMSSSQTHDSSSTFVA